MSTYTVVSGYYDTLKQTYRSSNSNTWNSYSGSSWSAWTQWNGNPGTLTLRIDDDLGSSTVRVASLDVFFEGDIAYQLKTSDTGAFAGEEATINFVVGTTYSIPSARYYRWTLTVVVGPNGEIPEIRSAVANYTTLVTTEYLRRIDTSTLSGTISGRTVTHSFGTIYSVDMTAYNDTSWIDRAYVLPDSYSVSTISPVPGIVSTSPLTIVLRDHFGVPVNGYVDITIRGTPLVQIASTGVSII